MPSLRTGILSFGLVSIPVTLHTATRAEHVSFNLLHAKCGSRIQNQYVCTVCNVVVERDDHVRGYELNKGQYVQFTEAELGSLEAESGNSIDLKEFIPISTIDPVYSIMPTIWAPAQEAINRTGYWPMHWPKVSAPRSLTS
jgi:DNA end-binding protein Ku